jgi:hypothetical protein
MTMAEMVFEMIRKPDAHLALEWIANEAVTLDDAQTVAAAYLEALED